MMELQDTTARAFVDSLRSRSENTARSYSHAIGTFLLAAGKPVSEITVPDALLYVGSLSHLSVASRAHHISAVRSFLKFCQSQGIIPQTPLDALRRPRVAITSMNRYVTREEAERLLEAAKGISQPCWLACTTLLLTGLRVSELAAAEWRHAYQDPEGRMGLLVIGKGGKERVVKLRGDLLALLQQNRQARGLPIELDARDKNPLIVSRLGVAYTTRGLQKLVAKAAKAAEIAKPVSPHWLRHSFATLAALGGAPAYQLQADLGHARLETSARYIHWARGLAESAVDALPLRTIR